MARLPGMAWAWARAWTGAHTQVVRLSWQAEGVRGFYRGLVPPLIGSTLSSMPASHPAAASLDFNCEERPMLPHAAMLLSSVVCC